LAPLTGLSERTIRRVENGEEARSDTLAVIAKHLGMDYDNLLALSDEKPARSSSDYIKLTISVEVPRELLVHAGEVQRFFDLVQQFIAAKDKFINPVVDVGSTLLTFELALADARLLCQHFIDGRLKQFNIISVQVPNDNADRERRIRSLWAMSEGMTGIADESDMLRREAAIRFAYRLVLLGKCDKKVALQTAERAILLHGTVPDSLAAVPEKTTDKRDVFAEPLLQQISGPESGKQLLKEIEEVMRSALREVSTTPPNKD